MDDFFQIYMDASPSGMLWFDEPLTMVNQSAFSTYTSQATERLASKRPWGNESNHRNINKRMIDFLKKSWVPPVYIETIESDTERSQRHKINERMRREKHKQNYLTLHKLLPIGTKNEKKSILEMAAKEIKDLQNLKEELWRKNRKMEMSLGGREKQKTKEKAEIKLKVDYPASGIDSMLEVLKCLKHTGSTATAIQSRFSQHEFTAVLELETKMRAAEVEKAVQRTLYETERKFHHQL